MIAILMISKRNNKIIYNITKNYRNYLNFIKINNLQLMNYMIKSTHLITLK